MRLPWPISTVLLDPRSAVLDDAWRGANELSIRLGRLSERPGAAGATLDARGLVVMHGFVDTHIHGVGPWRFWGHESSREYVRHLHGAARLLPRHGVCAFMPTSITEADAGRALISAVAAVCGAAGRDDQQAGARVLGSHAEGPFLNVEFIGAHTRDAASPISESSVTSLFDWASGTLRVITASPSLEDFGVLARAAADRGTTLQLGHDHPSPESFQRAVDAGASGVTHLFNAMGGLHHRRDDFAAMALVNDHLHLELILNPGFVALSWILVALSAGPSRVIGVSDCVGDLHGTEVFNGTRVSPGLNGVWVRSLDGATWASTASISDHLPMLLNARAEWDVVSRVLALNAIKRFDLDLGTAPGDRANLVCLDPSGAVVATVIDGRLEWLSDERRFVR